MLRKNIKRWTTGIGILAIALVVIYGCKNNSSSASDVTGITDFSIQDFDSEFTIDQNTQDITNGTDSLPYGTDASALVAEFETVPNTTVTVDGEEQISGETVNDFTSPVPYTAIAEDGETTEEYLVTVTVAQQNPEAVQWAEVASDPGWGPFTQSIAAQTFDGDFWVLGFSASNLYFDMGDQVFSTYSSSDGASWMEVTAEDDQGNAMPEAVNAGLVNYDGQMWLVNGVIPPEGFSFEVFTNKSWYTTDGENWTMVDPGSESSYEGRESHNTVVFDGRIYTIGGYSSVAFGNPAPPRNDVWSTTDGQTWTEETDNAGFDARYYPAAFVYDGQIWVTGGQKADGTLMNDVWTSSDGSTWSEVSQSSPYDPRFGHKIVVYDDRLWLIGGEGEDSAGDPITYANMWVSEDGSEWEEVTSDQVVALPDNFESRARHEAFVHNDQIWIMGGYHIDDSGQKSHLNDVWRGQLNALSKWVARNL